MVIKGVALIFLLAETIEDIRFRSLKTSKLIIWGVAAVIIKYCFLRQCVRELPMDILIGIIALLMCRITNEAIGYGDGVVILILGIMCGMEQTLKCCLISWVVFILWALVILSKKGFKKNLSLPFVTCLFLGYIGGIFI